MSKNANLEPRYQLFVVCSRLSVMRTIAKFKRAMDEDLGEKRRGLHPHAFLIVLIDLN